VSLRSQRERVINGERRKSRRRVFTSKGRSSATQWLASGRRFTPRRFGTQRWGGSASLRLKNRSLAPDYEHRSFYPLQQCPRLPRVPEEGAIVIDGRSERSRPRNRLYVPLDVLGG